MVNRVSRRLLSIGIVCAGASTAWAHHSQSEFDFRTSVQIEGTVTNLDWRSPHARLYVHATSGEGKAVEWDFELPSPITLMRRGWTRNSLKPGDKVKVKAAPARHAPNIAYASVIRDSNDKPLFTGVTRIYEPDPVSKTP